MNIYFYYINSSYIDYLKEFEKRNNNYTCIPNIEYKTTNKFMFGSVLDIDGLNYFVPVSSYNKPKEDVILIRDKKEKSKILGSLRFAYMIPVPAKCLIKLDISKISNEYSKVHISKELAFCRRERDKIFKQAQKTYYRVVNKANPQLVKNSCDFKLLEEAYKCYCRENNIYQTPSAADVIKEMDTWAQAVNDNAQRDRNKKDSCER